MKTKEVLALLVGLCILAGTWVSISQAWAINFAFVDLSHAALRSDDEAATRFERWAWMNTRSVRERDAAAYGMAMLVANERRERPERWLQEWEGSDSHLWADTLRGQMMLYALAGTLAPDDLMAMLDDLEPPISARWLVSAAERRPEEAGAFVQIVEDRELPSALSPDDRIRLATVYGHLALGSYRRGSTEEAMALANKSLGLDPQNELGMSVKALVLSRLDQLQAGLTLLDQVTSLYPESVFGWECLGDLKLRSKDFQGAERASRMALSLSSPGEIWAYDLLTVALLKQDRCAEALLYAQSAVRQSPDAGYSLLLLGDAYWCLGDREQASLVYQRLVTMYPEYAPRVRERIISDE